MTHEQAIPVGVSYYWVIPNVKLDGVQITTANPPTSFLASVYDDTGTIITSGTALTEDAANPGTWRVKLLAPSTPKRLRLRAEAISGASVGRWMRTLVVEDYR